MMDDTYRQALLREVHRVLEPEIARKLRAAENARGVKLKVESVSLKLVAEEQREAYDVFLTMVPDRSTQTTSEVQPAPQPPEVANASV